MSTFQSSDGVNLFYQDFGQGKPVVFVHSWGLDSQMWGPYMLHFQALGMRVIAMDRRGHGRSDQPGYGYDYDRLADDLAELIEQLDLHDVTLIGHSMGTGECTRLLARHRNERIARAIYIAPVAPCLIDADGNKITKAMVAPVLADISSDFPLWLEQGADGFFLPDETGTSAGTIRRTIDIMLAASLCAVVACFLTRVEGDLRDDLRMIDIPLLVLHGDRDQSEPMAHGLATVALVSGAQFVKYANAPHGIYQTHRAQLLADMQAFMGDTTE
ncbi:alpha/beta fold hydrolase [Dyella sp. 20L07]|uniref:alpha/beta fold hydrolase n=1 Tax=Dyella sp. 20L07 TaxID=3384240 RepID=UPI003D2897DC